MKRWQGLATALVLLLMMSGCTLGKAPGSAPPPPATGGGPTQPGSGDPTGGTPAPGDNSGAKPGDKPGDKPIDKPGDKPGQPPVCEPGQAADYFPYKVGTKGDYAGLGNEFASYKVDVLHQGSNKVEWRKNNGGTTLAEVYQVQPSQITLIYREPEAYNNTSHLNSTANQNEVVLKGPIQVGTQWTSGTTTYKITAVSATVQALTNQTLSCVVVVDATGAGLIRYHWHKNYGMVLSVFDPAGTPVESRLKTFTP